MRVLIAVALLALCGCAKQAVQNKNLIFKQLPPDATVSWVVYWPDHASIKFDCAFNSTGEMPEICGKTVGFYQIRIEQPAAKQEKAQTIVTGTKSCPSCNHVPQQALPFDLPAKEWDGPDTHPANTCARPWDTCAALDIELPTHHISCKDVAPDWQQRVLLDSADGKHHCYAFYLLEQKP